MATTNQAAQTNVNGNGKEAKIDPAMAALFNAMKAEFEAKLAALATENAALKAGEKVLSLKVSDKGALSVYGLGRFPTTLYAPQWLRLLDNADKVRDFIESNKNSLSWEKTKA